jgi:hypothetical protein
MMPNAPRRRAIANPATRLEVEGQTYLIRFDDDALIELEIDLDDLLDRVNARLERVGQEPYESVWEALEEISVRYPLQAVRRMLARVSADGEVALPVRALTDPKVSDALTTAISTAFGAHRDELPQEETVEGPPPLDDDDDGSTG